MFFQGPDPLSLDQLFLRAGIAMGIGLLIGLQRERKRTHLAGIRTFPLVAMLGSISALLAGHFGSWVLIGSFVVLTLTTLLTQIPLIRDDEKEIDFTSLVALLLMFCLGAYLMIGSVEIAVAFGAISAALLQFKGELRGFVSKLGDNDLKAIMTFALISLVVLPALPNKYYGPYGVLNPYQIWWMVVLVAGISLTGYVVYKFFGEKAGILAGGILGGLISSTATTMGFSRQTRINPDLNSFAAIIILISSSIVYIRLIIEVAIVAPIFLVAAAIPLAIVFSVLAGSALVSWFSGHRGSAVMPEQENPTELKTAIIFGLLFALVILGSAFAKDFFGASGLYGVALIAGLTDVDAITLSTSQLVNSGQVLQRDGAKVILTATLSNLFFKFLIVMLLGHRSLAFRILPFFGAAFITGVLLILFS
jgi:uncharacterized membrane protein (DUF4010 family)